MEYTKISQEILAKLQVLVEGNTKEEALCVFTQH